jgi:MtN3 and saliva related transmembrane protein
MAGTQMIELVGGAAAVLTTASFLPQAIRVIRTNDTAAISLAMYVMFTAGVGLWFAYGLAIGSAPVIAANAVTFALAAIILTQKIRHTLAARKGPR